MLDRRFGEWRGKGKGKAPHGKREKEKRGTVFRGPIPLGDQTARTNARTNGTKRNHFPVDLTVQAPNNIPTQNCLVVFDTNYQPNTRPRLRVLAESPRSKALSRRMVIPRDPLRTPELLAIS